MPKKLPLQPNYQKSLNEYNEIITIAKRIEGLSNLRQWQEVVSNINRRIQGLARSRDNILCGGNRDIPIERELAEVKSIAREIRALEEIRDIEKGYTKGVNDTLEKKKKLEELIEKQKQPKPKRTHTY